MSDKQEINELRNQVAALEVKLDLLRATACLCHCKQQADGTWQRIRTCQRCEILEA